MKSRRKFIQLGALSGAALIARKSIAKDLLTKSDFPTQIVDYPIIVSTWEHGLAANEAAWKVLKSQGSALDAVETGVRATESDPEVSSVGLGGLPDREGIVTLDACIMDHENNCGAVAALEKIENPISVARKVMEKTPHVMLVGKGAQAFAFEQGFPAKNLLTPKSKLAWENWKKDARFQPKINSENHDTISMLAIDASGNLAGACTTSGMAYKLHGRVGDSPIIGAGLFVDNEIGAACATGVGEAIVRIAGSAIVVELMRNGKSPQQACEEAVNRIVKKHKSIENLQVGFLAINKQGEVGAFSIYSGFNFALKTKNKTELIDSKFIHKEV